MNITVYFDFHNERSVIKTDIVCTIVEKFKSVRSWDVVEFSHYEKAWKDLHNEKELINYQKYAFDLNLD